MIIPVIEGQPDQNTMEKEDSNTGYSEKTETKTYNEDGFLEDNGSVMITDNPKTEFKDNGSNKKQKKKRKEFKKKRKQTKKIDRLNVFVTGINHSVGTSYISGSLASAITDLYDTEVLLDHKRDCSLPDNYMVSEVKTDADKTDALRNGFIIQDKGVYENLDETDKNDLMYADIKIMVSTADDRDLQKISQFINEMEDDVTNWLFVFNHVLDHQKDMLKAAMKNYNYIIIAFHDNAEVPDEIKQEWEDAIEYFSNKK